MITSTTVTFTDPGGDLQAAIDATPEGGTLRIGPGVYVAPDASGFVISRSITIEGSGRPYVWDGIGPPVVAWDYGTVLRPYTSAATSDGAKDSTVLNIVPSAGQIIPNVVVKNLGIEHPYALPATPATIGTGDGIRFDCSAAGSQVAHSRVENVSIRGMGRDGIHVSGGTGYGSLDQTTFSRIDVITSRRHGIYFKYATDVAFDNCLLSGNQRCGMYFEACLTLLFFHCLFNGNGPAFVNDGSAAWSGVLSTWPYYDQAQMYFNGVQRLTITGCDFEKWSGEFVSAVWTPAAVQTAIGMYNVNGGTITGCTTYNADYVHGAIESWFIALLDSVSGLFIAGNHLAGCDFGVIGLTNHAVRGNVCLMNAVTDYEASPGNDAPCRVQLPGASETSHATPSGGNFALVPLMNAALIDSDTVGARWCAGVQVPTVSSTAAILNGDVQAGTITADDSEKALRVYQDGAWQTVAAGLVAIDGDIVTHDDEPVSY